MSFETHILRVSDRFSGWRDAVATVQHNSDCGGLWSDWGQEGPVDQFATLQWSHAARTKKPKLKPKARPRRQPRRRRLLYLVYLSGFLCTGFLLFIIIFVFFLSDFVFLFFFSSVIVHTHRYTQTLGHSGVEPVAALATVLRFMRLTRRENR